MIKRSKPSPDVVPSETTFPSKDSKPPAPCFILPPGQIAAHDAGETIAEVWITPHEALARHRAGEIEIIFPTIRNLQAVARFSHADEVLNYARSLEAITCVQPTIVDREGVLFIQTPSDEGFKEYRL